jgi:hypothetical protein
MAPYSLTPLAESRLHLPSGFFRAISRTSGARTGWRGPAEHRDPTPMREKPMRRRLFLGPLRPQIAQYMPRSWLSQKVLHYGNVRSHSKIAPFRWLWCISARSAAGDAKGYRTSLLYKAARYTIVAHCTRSHVNVASLCKCRLPIQMHTTSGSAGRKQILLSAHRACLFSRLSAVCVRAYVAYHPRSCPHHAVSRSAVTCLILWRASRSDIRISPTALRSHSSHTDVLLHRVISSSHHMSGM